MKKGRLGTLITILADDDHVPALEQLLLRETSTLGIRIHHERRSCLDRAHTTVTTPYGDIRIKIGSRDGEIFNAAPEFEDCRTAAAKHNVAIKTVQQAATSAYLQTKQ
jgi:pyridinium-3,5-bisthiocarboxylic acid mononucleotide nickel chelatase